jgi:hypothetical protein
MRRSKILDYGDYGGYLTNLASLQITTLHITRQTTNDLPTVKVWTTKDHGQCGTKDYRQK